MRELIDSEGVSRGLRRVAGQIVERQRGAEGLVLIGVCLLYTSPSPRD